MLESFLIKLEDCIFLQNEELVEKADTLSLPGALDKMHNPTEERIRYVWIRIDK